MVATTIQCQQWHWRLNNQRYCQSAISQLHLVVKLVLKEFAAVCGKLWLWRPLACCQLEPGKFNLKIWIPRRKSQLWFHYYCHAINSKLSQKRKCATTRMWITLAKLLNWLTGWLTDWKRLWSQEVSNFKLLHYLFQTSSKHTKPLQIAAHNDQNQPSPSFNKAFLCPVWAVLQFLQCFCVYLPNSSIGRISC